MASPWKQEFKDFKPLPPPWLSTGRKATPGVDYYDPRKPYGISQPLKLQKKIQSKFPEFITFTPQKIPSKNLAAHLLV